MAVTPKSAKLNSDTLSKQETKAFKPPSISNSLSKSKTIFLQQAGALKYDSSLADLRDSIYQARKRVS